MPLQAGKRFHSVLSLGPLALEVFLRGRMHPSLDDGNSVQRQIELPVAAAVQSPAIGLTVIPE